MQKATGGRALLVGVIAAVAAAAPAAASSSGSFLNQFDEVTTMAPQSSTASGPSCS
jgi:hypothetical protein